MESPFPSDGILNNTIYKVSRAIKRVDNTLYNSLRSIYQDSIFVGEISQLWPQLPLLANLRCGLWYSPKFDSTCYFKSTDGHTNNLSFNTSRLNLHVALLAGQRGGCIIIDSTRKGKKFPDSMSKTIPIWTCVLNRAILNYRTRLDNLNTAENELIKSNEFDNIRPDSSCWDCSLHLPHWVSETEKAMIESRLEGWTKDLEASGADIASIELLVKKPLRPLWISQKTVIWLNEVPEYDSWDFTPIILVSASSSSGNFQNHTTSEFSWNYIAGAGDDEESWSRGLSPDLFWKHAHDLMRSDPALCNQKIASIVEKDRAHCAQSRENAPQVSVPSKLGSTSILPLERLLDLNIRTVVDDEGSISWLGPSNVAVGRNQLAMEVSPANCILHCDRESFDSLKNSGLYLHLPIEDSKFDRFSLLRNLPSALDFAKIQLGQGKTLLVCCRNGEDISICICLAILTSLYDELGHFDDGKSFSKTLVTKLELRRRLVFISKFAVNARPSRGNLRQVFNWLNGGCAHVPSVS